LSWILWFILDSVLKHYSAGGWTKVHNEEFHLMRWVGHVTHTGKSKIHISVWSENLMGRNYLGDLGVDGRIILNTLTEF
jgi:hypothetical protein